MYPLFFLSAPLCRGSDKNTFNCFIFQTGQAYGNVNGIENE